MMDLISSQFNDNDQQQSVEENTQPVKQIRRLKNPIERDALLDKYSPQSQSLKKCLPAGFSQHPIYGELIMSFSPVVFDPSAPISKSKHVLYRCHMLGYSKSQQPLFPNQINYTVHTNNKMFKNYLKDMKICVVDIVDARNYQSIGHCYVNWLMHMRSIGDEEVYVDKGNDPVLGRFEEYQKKFFLPFIDESCTFTLPVFDYRNPKAKPVSIQHQTPQNQKLLYLKNNPHEKVIGQVELKFTSRIYENSISQGYNAQSQNSIESQQNKNSQIDQLSNKGLAKQGYLQLPKHRHTSVQKDAISLTNFLPEGVSSKSIRQNALGDEYIVSSRLRKYSNMSSHPMKSQYYKQSQKKMAEKAIHPQSSRGSRIWLNNQQCQQNVAQKQNERQNPAKNQIQLMQLKLQVQEFFDVKQSTTQPKLKEDKIILSIVKLKSKLQNINQLDIFVGDNEISLQQNPKNVDKRQRLKIYRVDNDKLNSLDLFKSKIIIENPAIKTVEIQLPNSQGKCSFRCKDLIQTYNYICVYNKGIIVGVLTVKKQVQSHYNVPMKNLYPTPSIQREVRQEVIKSVQDKICIIMIDNFMENFHKKFDINEISYLDNYFVSIKNVNFYHQTLTNSKITGDYAIANALSIPKIFAVQVKNSNHQFVGMSQNIAFQGNQVSVSEKNIMPSLILERNISIQLKQMPIFKKIPNSICFRLSIYICNTNQLNFFINKWKQNVAKTKMIEAKKQRSNSNVRTLVPKQSEKQRQKQYTISDEGISQRKNDQKRLRTQSQNKNYIDSNHHHSLSSDLRDEEKQRSKTHGNYTIDLQNRTSMEEKPPLRKENYSQHSQKQDEGNDLQNEEIYLVQFFCKSLHYVLSKLGSKKMIEDKLTELSKFEVKNEQNKDMISRQDFKKILHLFIGSLNENHQQLLGFNVNEILEALFTSEDNQMIKLKEFTLCLMAYYNFLLLLANEKFISLKEILAHEPEAQNKLLRIQQSMTNISSEFLWEDMLPNVLEKTKKKINKRYRIYANTPFSVDFLLKDIKTFKKNIENSSDEPFFMNLLDILISGQEKKEELFMRTTADLGSLVRQTVEQIIFAQCLKSSNANFDKNWFQKIQVKMQEYIVKENLQSISSDQKNGYCFNLSQFQQFFIGVGIETSIWESLMLIQEIKVWYQTDQTKNQEFSDLGEGVITFQLLKLWFKGLKFKAQMKTKQNLIGQKINSKSSRLNSIQSIDSEEQFIIEEMNSKRDTIKNTIKNSGINMVVQKYPPKAPINKVSPQQFASELNQRKYFDQKHRQTQKSFLKESQSIMNNESDIANIANLLRENDNNLYFLPSMVNEPNPMNRLVSEKNISDSDILRGLDYETLRNEIQALPTKKTNTIETNRNQYQKIEQSNSQTNMELQKMQVEKKRPKLQPIDAFLSVSLKQIKLKKKQAVTEKLGLKKLIFSMDKSSCIRSLESNKENENGNEYFFLTQDTIGKILNNDCSSKQIEKYRLKCFKIDINNLYDFQTTYNQGFSLKLMNLTSSKNKLSEEKIEKLLISGILPIEDILNVVQEFKTKFSPNDQKSESLIVSKRKTMVLYSGRQLNGKAVLEISVSNKAEDNNLHQDNGMRQDMNCTTIEFLFQRKALISQGKRNKITKEEFSKDSISLCYCSIRNEDKNIEILSKIEQSEVYEIHLPQPIIEYQLIICASNQQNNQPESMPNSRINQMSVSRFTQIGNVQGQVNRGSQQCIIPLQNLYFKKSLKNQYPLIDKLTGRFVCSIEASLHVIESQKIQSQEMSQIGNQDDI